MVIIGGIIGLILLFFIIRFALSGTRNELKRQNQEAELTRSAKAEYSKMNNPNVTEAQYIDDLITKKRFRSALFKVGFLGAVILGIFIFYS